MFSGASKRYVKRVIIFFFRVLAKTFSQCNTQGLHADKVGSSGDDDGVISLLLSQTSHKFFDVGCNSSHYIANA